jgi:hypothetical protein
MGSNPICATTLFAGFPAQPSGARLLPRLLPSVRARPKPKLEMGIRKRGEKWLVTAGSGVDEFGVCQRVCRDVATEDEAKRLEVKLQHGIYKGQHVKPSTESVASFCARYLEDHRDARRRPMRETLTSCARTWCRRSGASRSPSSREPCFH